MKCTVVIDKSREEEIIVYLKEPRSIARKVEELAESDDTELIGYGERSTVVLKSVDIFAVFVEDGKTYAYTKNEKLRLKQRLYTLEEKLGREFVKINQSCLVRVDSIVCFDASFGGALTVTLKNGYRDYVSRRQLRIVKERIGMKK